MLTRKPNLVQAARQVMEWGPRVVVAKQGEYGAALVTEEGFFGLPAYPLETVLDPTGAGDSFAGGFMGYIAAHPDEEIDDELLRRAMAYGTALASFNVEEFGTERVQRLTAEEIAERVERAAAHHPTSWTPRSPSGVSAGPRGPPGRPPRLGEVAQRPGDEGQHPAGDRRGRAQGALAPRAPVQAVGGAHARRQQAGGERA